MASVDNKTIHTMFWKKKESETVKALENVATAINGLTRQMHASYEQDTITRATNIELANKLQQYTDAINERTRVSNGTN